MTGARIRIVEFFGLPGTGKTTIANQCIAIARSRGDAVYSSADAKRMFPPTGLRRLGRIAAAAPLAWRPMYLALKAPPFLRLPLEGDLLYRTRAAWNAPIYFLPLMDIERAPRPASIILDEWLTQKLWGACLLGECRLSTAAQFIRHFTTCFDVQHVLLDLEPGVAVERAYERTARRKQGLESNWNRVFDEMTGRDLAATYQTGHEISLHIRGILKDAGAACIRIDGTRSAEENSRIIADALLRPPALASEDHGGALRGSALRRTLPGTGREATADADLS